MPVGVVQRTSTSKAVRSPVKRGSRREGECSKTMSVTTPTRSGASRPSTAVASAGFSFSGPKSEKASAWLASMLPQRRRSSIAAPGSR